MRRREFIMLVGGAAAFWPAAVRAQQPALPVIGFLSGASLHTMRDYVTVFQQSLAETGFTEGREVAIDYRWPEGNMQREILAMPAGQEYANVVGRHASEVQTLINTNRRVATVWQRCGRLR